MILRSDNGHGGAAVMSCDGRAGRIEDVLRVDQERYALVARGANDGLWDWDLRTNEIEFSARWKALLGLGDEDVGRGPDEWLGRVHSEDREALEAAIAEHLRGGTECLYYEHRLRHRIGDYRWSLVRGVAARDEQGQAYRLAGSLTDVTDRRAAEERLLHDGLTGLPNRRVFLGLLERAMRRRSREPEYACAVVHVDLDRLTVVNDSLGHAIGDQLLVAVASRLQGCVRPGDVVARLDGDEFIILLNDVKDSADTIRVTERIQQAILVPFSLDGREVFTSASMGIAVEAADHDRPEHLLRDAHAATQRAKARGGARYEMYDPQMHARAVAHLQLETDLRRGVEREEFRLYYQPIVSLAARRIVGFEALVRWVHPQRGLVSPAEFIPVAEATGLIVPLGWWVLRQAGEQARVWSDQFPELQGVSVSVNVSPRQFQQADLVARVAEVMQETGVSPACVKLEITESVLMDDPESAFAAIERLRALGVHVDIDDFGTGYSSLSYLHRLPVGGLKIDRSFIGALDGGRGTSEIVRTIVQLAGRLELQVIAEGVETEAQAARLRTLGCERGQGYLFHRPMDAAAAAALLGGEPCRSRAP